MRAGIPLKPLVIVEHGQLINLIDNNFNLSMHCGDYDKDFEYKWEKKNENISLKAQGIKSHHLTIINLEPADSGEYRCVMSNFTGRLFSDYSLIIVKGTYVWLKLSNMLYCLNQNSWM